MIAADIGCSDTKREQDKNMRAYKSVIIVKSVLATEEGLSAWCKRDNVDSIVCFYTCPSKRLFYLPIYRSIHPSVTFSRLIIHLKLLAGITDSLQRCLKLLIIPPHNRASGQQQMPGARKHAAPMHLRRHHPNLHSQNTNTQRNMQIPNCSPPRHVHAT